MHSFNQLLKKGISARLYIVGDGPLKEPIKQLISQLQLDENVQLLGKLAKAETHASIAKCWCLVVPSEYDEAAAYVIAEAHAVQRPVIASNRGGIPEQVGPGGLIFEAGNIDVLLEQMVTLAQNKSIAMEYGQKGYTYNLERMGSAQAFLNLYNALLKKQKE